MRTLLTTFAALLALSLVPSPAHAVTTQEIFAKVDANLTYDTRESTVSMTVTKNGRTNSYTMHSYGKGQDIAAVEYLEPARDKGTKMLKLADNLSMYLPSMEKTQKISGHMLRQSMMGSDLSYEDMMQASKWQTMYTGTVQGEETVDGHKCWKIEMKANSADVSYPKRIVWIDEAAYIPVKQELYALSGMLLKTWTMGEVKVIGARQFPMKMVVEDKLQQGSSTTLTFQDIKFSVALEDEVFTERWLER